MFSQVNQEIDSNEDDEQPMPVTPSRTFVNSAMKQSYVPAWTQIREKSEQHLLYKSHGNRT